MGPTAVQINHKNLLHNLTLIKTAVQPSRVMAVVKADAYGHGSVEISKTLVDHGVDYLAVAFHEEGIELRNAGLTVPILVFGAQLPAFFEAHLAHDLDITVTSMEQIDALETLCSQQNKKARVHLKVDTGMNRVGFPVETFIVNAKHILSLDFLDIIGVYSHLSSSDEDDLSYTRLQVERFSCVRETVTRYLKKPALFHLANSGAIMRLPESYLDYVRPGVMLYGNPPSPDFPLRWNLKEVMRFVSKVTLIKNIHSGEPISYSRRYYTKSPTRIAVVPVGYADGFNRRLTNTGTVLIRGNRFPVAGTVCMDQILVDLGSDSPVSVGDEVVLFGEQAGERISIVELSRQLGTIPYEVTCWPSQRVPRLHNYNG